MKNTFAICTNPRKNKEERWVGELAPPGEAAPPARRAVANGEGYQWPELGAAPIRRAEDTGLDAVAEPPLGRARAAALGPSRWDSKYIC